MVLSNSSQFACEELVRLANDRGGADNVTVQVLRSDRLNDATVSFIPKEARSPKSGSGWLRWLLLFLFILIVVIGLFIFKDEIPLGKSQNVKQMPVEDQLNKLSQQDNDKIQEKLQLDSLYSEAQGLMSGNNYDDAVAKYHEILRQSPMHIGAIDGINQISELYKNRGERLLREKRYRQSINAFNKALILRPKDVEIQKKIEKIKNLM